VRNRPRFLLEGLDAVREEWPERVPLTMQLGSDDFRLAGTRFEDSVEDIGWMKEHGLDLADLSMGGTTDDMVDPHFFNEPAGSVPRTTRVRRGVGIPVATSWNLGIPQTADAFIRSRS
jgi:2,4-dienoyl-CoA reductase-like NADH-dependent reductase (Old Yellow Enzyme family)